MIRRLPLMPTLLVAAAVATMLALGAWQLRRAGEKDALIARYVQASARSAPVAWPRNPREVGAALYQRSRVVCERVLSRRATAGRNAEGEPGWAHIARCALDGGGEADIVLGWSRDPREAEWDAGEVSGTVSPAPSGAARLVAKPPLAGLGANAAPDPGELPNNHRAYALQWFFFAATAAVIYLLAVRKRLRGR